jgi:putative transposon-encoded protein
MSEGKSAAKKGEESERSTAVEPAEIKMLGFEVVEKMAMPCSSSARILVPKHWVGKRVRAVRLDP